MSFFKKLFTSKDGGDKDRDSNRDSNSSSSNDKNSKRSTSFQSNTTSTTTVNNTAPAGNPSKQAVSPAAQRRSLKMSTQEPAKPKDKLTPNELKALLKIQRFVRKKIAERLADEEQTWKVINTKLHIRTLLILTLSCLSTIHATIHYRSSLVWTRSRRRRCFSWLPSSRPC